MSFIQGFVVAVPNAEREPCRAHAAAAAPAFKDLGAAALLPEQSGFREGWTKTTDQLAALARDVASKGDG